MAVAQEIEKVILVLQFTCQSNIMNPKLLSGVFIRVNVGRKHEKTGLV